MEKRVKWLIFLLILLAIVMIEANLFFIRALGPSELDDVHPDINCSEAYINEADILWIIPKYNGSSIADNKDWCKKIKSKNKILGLHGLYHTYEEFANESKVYDLVEAVEIFEECFGQKPLYFKAPQLKVSEENKEIIEDLNMTLKGKFNSVAHKVYHCKDAGKISNNLIRAF